MTNSEHKQSHYLLKLTYSTNAFHPTNLSTATQSSLYILEIHSILPHLPSGTQATRAHQFKSSIPYIKALTPATPKKPLSLHSPKQNEVQSSLQPRRQCQPHHLTPQTPPRHLRLLRLLSLQLLLTSRIRRRTESLSQNLRNEFKRINGMPGL